MPHYLSWFVVLAMLLGWGSAVMPLARVTQADHIGFTVTESDGNTTVNESGTTDTFTVGLTAQPTSDVVILVTSGDTGEATVAPFSLAFTRSTWDIPQTVTVTGVPDGIIDGNQTTVITLSVDDAHSAAEFHAVPNQTVSAITIDNDGAGITVRESGGDTTVREAGASPCLTTSPPFGALSGPF